MTRRPSSKTHVRYVSPYAPPRIVTRAFADKQLEEDRRRWLRDWELGRQTDEQRTAGPPRMEALPAEARGH